MNKVQLILTSFCLLLIISCSEEDNLLDSADSAITTLSGTYTATSMTVHSSGDCDDGAGSEGYCIGETGPDFTANSSSDCTLTGICMNGSGTTEETCDNYMWFSGMCSDESGTTEATCTAGQWLSFGWNPYISTSVELSFAFTATGYTGPDSSTMGTYTISGTTITMSDSTNSYTGIMNATGTSITTEIMEDMEDTPDDASDDSCVTIIWTLGS